MARTGYFDEPAIGRRPCDVGAVAPRLLDGRLVVAAAVHDEQGRHLRYDAIDRRGAPEDVRRELPRQRWDRGQIVEASDQDAADDAGRPLGCQQRGEMGPRVFAEQDQLIGVDAQFTRAAADEGDRRAHVGERFFMTRQASEAIVHGEPVIAGVRQQLEELPDMRRAAARGPAAAVNDDHCGPRGSPR